MTQARISQGQTSLILDKSQPTWLWQGEPLQSPPLDAQGFVYLITNLELDKRYIGKKNFWTVKKLPPLKGKRNRRHRRVETDWRNYWGSNTDLQADVKTFGKDCFRRDIIRLCATKTDMAYWETHTQFRLGVLFDDAYYNQYIGCRVTSRGLTQP